MHALGILRTIPCASKLKQGSHIFLILIFAAVTNYMLVLQASPELETYQLQLLLVRLLSISLCTVYL